MRTALDEAWPQASKKTELSLSTTDRAIRLPLGRHALRLVADGLFAGFLILAAILRWQVMASDPEPTGIDPGNWLAFGHSLLGSHARSGSLIYPPLVPLAVAALVAQWGLVTGLRIMATIASLFPALGTYVLLRSHLRLRALFLASLLAVAATTGEAMAWGGYPQLIGLGLLSLFLWTLNRYLDTFSLRWAFASSILLLVSLMTSDLVGVAAVVIGLVLVALRVIVESARFRLNWLRIVVAVTSLLTPLLFVSPVYVGLVGGVLQNETTNRSSQHLSFATLVPDLSNLFKENPGFWFLALAVACASPIALLIVRGRALASASTAILLPVVGGMLLVHEVRLAFVLPIATVSGLGALWALLLKSKRRAAVWFDYSLVAVSLVVLVTESSLGITEFNAQSNYYRVLTPGIVRGLDALDRIAPSNAHLAVGPGPGEASVQGWPFGWWVEGLLDRPTMYACSAQWLNFSDERQRAAIANKMFDANGGVSDAIAIAKVNHVDYLVVATGWLDYREWILRQPLSTDSVVVISTESILVIHVDK